MIAQGSREFTRQQVRQGHEPLRRVILPQRAGLLTQGERVPPPPRAKGPEPGVEHLLALLLHAKQQRQVHPTAAALRTCFDLGSTDRTAHRFAQTSSR